MTAKVTTDTSAKLTATLDTLSLLAMQAKAAVAEYKTPLWALAAVIVYAQTEQALTMLWLIKEVHAGVALLCAASAAVGFIARRR